MLSHERPDLHSLASVACCFVEYQAGGGSSDDHAEPQHVLEEEPSVESSAQLNVQEPTCTETQESFVPLDEMEPKLMSCGQKKMRKDQVHELNQSDVALWNTLRGARKGRVERAEWYPALKWMYQAKTQAWEIRKVLLENLWTSELWETLCVRKLIVGGIHDNETLELLELVRGDQREYGLVNRDSGLPNLKPTGSLTATEPVKRNLQCRCSGGRVHQQLVGVNRTRRAQEWPEPLCQAMLSGFVEELEGRSFHAAFYNESLQEHEQQEELRFGTLDAIHDERDYAPPRDLLPAHLNEDELKRPSRRNFDEPW